MQRFYQLRRKDGITKVEALRQAQLALLHGAAGEAQNAPAATERGAARATAAGATSAAPAFVADPARRYAHPYFWAPFILMGNWL
jgi:CHAT domain-containing protein